MTTAGIPAAVLQFVLKRIESVAELETLLIMSADEARAWSVEDIATRIYVAAPSAAAILHALQQRRLIQNSDDGIRFRFSPASDEERQAVLQTANAGDAGQIEQRTKARLASARKDLGDIKYADLSAEAKAQYDRAFGLIRQADNALRVKNYPFAEELAGKAATLASQLRKFNDPISF